MQDNFDHIYTFYSFYAIVIKIEMNMIDMKIINDKRYNYQNGKNHQLFHSGHFDDYIQIDFFYHEYHFQ